MSKQPLTISEEAKVQMPMKTVASLIALVAIGTWAFFSIQEKLNQHATQLQIKSTRNSTTNYGEGSYREHGFPNRLAPWTFRILAPLIQNNLC